ncbi:MAG: helix-turn-helix domain-containing protein [Draconibacterium sp.]
MEHLKFSLLISSFVIPLLLSVTILAVAKNDLSKKVMGLALLNAFFVFLANYFYFMKMFREYSYLHSLHIAAVLWLFPSLFLYVKTIVGKNFKKDLLHLLPGVVFGSISAILFYGFLNLEERVYYLSNYRTGMQFEGLSLKVLTIFRLVDVIFIVVQVIYYSVLFIQVPRRYSTQLQQEYSNIEKFSIDWLYWFNIGFVVVGILCVLFYVFNPFHEENELFLILFLFIISAFIWIIGIWSFKQKKPQLITKLPDFVSTAKISENKDERAMEKILLQYFEKEKPYLNPELNLSDVCKHIGTNRTYLSNLINNQFEMNFNAFVNRYRLKEVMEYRKQHPSATNATLTDVGGFGSVSSLKRALGKQKLNSPN